MLYDPQTPSYMDLESFPGEVIVRVSFRKGWEKEDEFRNLPMHGHEGVVHYNKNGPSILEPFKETKWEKLFNITPDRKHYLDSFKYMIRWWRKDMLLPTTSTCFISIKKHETTWEFRSRNITLYGLQLNNE